MALNKKLKMQNIKAKRKVSMAMLYAVYYCATLYSLFLGKCYFGQMIVFKILFGSYREHNYCHEKIMLAIDAYAQ